MKKTTTKKPDKKQNQPKPAPAVGSGLRSATNCATQSIPLTEEFLRSEGFSDVTIEGIKHATSTDKFLTECANRAESVALLLDWLLEHIVGELSLPDEIQRLYATREMAHDAHHHLMTQVRARQSPIWKPEFPEGWSVGDRAVRKFARNVQGF